jgi:hypothetical protein
MPNHADGGTSRRSTTGVPRPARGMTQHIPNKGEHLIRYCGRYSNKKRGTWEKAHGARSP